jgi:Rod binding domain-containing protein
MMDGVGAGKALGLGPSQPKIDPGKLQQAAQDFESLLIAQMLKGMRENEGGWMGTGDDEAGASAMALAEEHFAQALAQGGGLGLRNLVLAGVEKKPA